MLRRARASIVAALAAAAVAVAACGGDDAAVEGSGPTEEVAATHVHGLGINPADGSLFVATHNGLFRAGEGEQAAKLVGDSTRDTMGFTVVGADHFLASGHPGEGESGPALLGLIESIDAGRSWEAVSLGGEADFHVLHAAGERVYGFDSANGRLLASTNEGQSWEQLEAPAPLLDLAVDPDDAGHVVASGEGGLFASSDGGESWQPAGTDLGLLAWPAGDRLYLATVDGGVQVSEDGGRSFDRVGAIGGQPAAFLGHEDDLYAALADGTVMRSTDGGASWTTRATLG